MLTTLAYYTNCDAMAEALVVSPVHRNIKSRNAYLRMKNCSPKFRTILRQRYKDRVESNRFKAFNNFRHIENADDKDRMDTENCFYSSEALFEDKDLFNGNDINLDEELLLEEILQEELTQFENWLLQEYELLWSEEETDSHTIITCPLCCSGHLETHHSISECLVHCTKCESSFNTERTLMDIQNDIFNEVDEHNKNCLSDPAFVKVPGNETHNNLCIVCDMCGYLQIII